jgi:hypothetical protein
MGDGGEAGVGFVIAGSDAPKLLRPLEAVLMKSRHLYISASCGIDVLRSALERITGMAPRSFNAARRALLSKACRL